MSLYKGVACIGTRSIRSGQCYGGGCGGNNVKTASLLLRTSCPIAFRSFCSASKVKSTTTTTGAASPSNHHHHQKGSSLLLFPDAVIHPRGDLPYGSREYLLLPPHVNVADLEYEPSLLIASIRAHRNILFDCRIKIHNASSGSTTTAAADNKDNESDGPIIIKQQQQQQHRLVQVCLPLVHAALQDAGSQGEQPQAVSTLHGLSSWVVECLEGRLESQVLNNLLLSAQSQQNATTGDTSTATAAAADIALGAVRAIATGIPRPGHSIVGVGSYRDGQVAWQALAKEYVHLSNAGTTATETTTTTTGVQQLHCGSQEAELYQTAGGQLVGIEYLADQQPAYLKSAGGAMARFFFL